MSANRLPRAETPLPLAEAIGNYDIVRKLATGGMGEVYLAKQRGPVAFSRDVVLKKLHPSFTHDREFVRMFLNEAQLAANLSHPNIIHIYDLFEHAGGYVIAMEYVRGGTALSLLREQARDGRAIPTGPALRIAIAVCEALHYAYTTPGEDGQPRRIVHRDVSPSNILVDYDGHVKLADFGVAKTLDANATQGASIKGKYGYLSPEQVRCKPLDQRSDLFALGIVLWEMLVGAPLFQRDNEVAMMYALVEEDIPPPSTRHPGIPLAIEDVVMKALARDRDRRYQTTAEFAAELKRVARELDEDIDAAALAALVKDALPDDQVAFGRIGSDQFSGLGPPAGEGGRAQTTFGRGHGAATDDDDDGDDLDADGADDDDGDGDGDDGRPIEIVLDAMSAPVPIPRSRGALTPTPRSSRSAIAGVDPSSMPVSLARSPRGAMMITTLVMLVLSALFWLLVVPQLD
jgi:tRNA A-37 threonylcarbamoyl transferase component Bud32